MNASKNDADKYLTYTQGGGLIVAKYKEEYICQSCLKNMLADYKGIDVDATTGSAAVPVIVTREAATFSVSVPTSIPVFVKADGSVNVPSSDAVKIVNNSGGSVKVSQIDINNGDWTITDYNKGDRSVLAAQPVNSKKLGLSLAVAGDAAVSSKDGNQTPTIDSSKWKITDKNSGNGELSISVGAIASSVSQNIDVAVTAANVVFTLAWE